ncbi:MAG: hypothetical protein IJL44_00900 [Bacteroidales bacterium]|nr:hypothetical protein [Bacteroidales bacterium]
MKKIYLLISLVGLLFLSVSCEHPEDNPWSRFYDFSSSDVIGTYSANPDESVYEESPTPGVVVYDNASVTITELGDGLVMVRVIIPDQINKVFTGAIEQNSSNGILLLNQGSYEEFSATVYKGNQGQIRLQGHESRTYYNAEGEISDKKIYGFDVIKTENGKRKTDNY